MKQKLYNRQSSFNKPEEKSDMVIETVKEDEIVVELPVEKEEEEVDRNLIICDDEDLDGDCEGAFDIGDCIADQNKEAELIGEPIKEDEQVKTYNSAEHEMDKYRQSLKDKKKPMESKEGKDAKVNK